MRVARFLPSAEALNLIVGVVSATAINLLTSVALDDRHARGLNWVVVSALLMLLGGLLLGALAVWLSGVRDETLGGLPISISARERRALLRNAIDRRGPRVVATVAGAVGLLLASGFVLLLR